MKKGSFSALLYRELLTVRKSIISYIVMTLIMLPIPFLFLLSFRHGNLGMFIPEDMHWIFLGDDGLFLKLFVLVGSAAIAMGSSDSMGNDISMKWDRFRHSTPVTPARMALAKITMQAMFTAAAVVISLLMIWLMDMALGMPFTAADVAMSLTLVAAVTLLSVLALLSVTLFRSVDKGMLALMGSLMAIVSPISILSKNDDSAPDNLEQMLEKSDKLLDFCTDLLPFLPFIILGTLVLGFVGLTLLYKRREK